VEQENLTPTTGSFLFNCFFSAGSRYKDVIPTVRIQTSSSILAEFDPPLQVARNATPPRIAGRARLPTSPSRVLQRLITPIKNERGTMASRLDDLRRALPNLASTTSIPTCGPHPPSTVGGDRSVVFPSKEDRYGGGPDRNRGWRLKLALRAFAILLAIIIIIFQFYVVFNTPSEQRDPSYSVAIWSVVSVALNKMEVGLKTDLTRPRVVFLGDHLGRHRIHHHPDTPWIRVDP
jgi:hypothetical protein